MQSSASTSAPAVCAPAVAATTTAANAATDCVVLKVSCAGKVRRLGSLNASAEQANFLERALSLVQSRYPTAQRLSVSGPAIAITTSAELLAAVQCKNKKKCSLLVFVDDGVQCGCIHARAVKTEAKALLRQQARDSKLAKKLAKCEAHPDRMQVDEDSKLAKQEARAAKLAAKTAKRAAKAAALLNCDEESKLAKKAAKQSARAAKKAAKAAKKAAKAAAHCGSDEVLPADKLARKAAKRLARAAKKAEKAAAHPEFAKPDAAERAARRAAKDAAKDAKLVARAARQEEKLQKVHALEAARIETLPETGGILVDGNNIMPCDSRLRSLMRGKQNQARKGLLEMLNKFAASSPALNVACIFDRNGEDRIEGLVSVTHSFDQIADDVIVTRLAAMEAVQRPIVVTSDRGLTLRLHDLGVRVMKSGWFYRLIRPADHAAGAEDHFPAL
eukprot:gnl/Hemi2/27862_TR9202_c0_g1_i1.p1 gnl/Hemi2/27862_TR9202_c0_g1~~gnl/Hemi2/27862_TR9202_c0_g1_i1.p1  ORF type:complete len:470 (+),score=214.27 gnl/Hemi2/27862_TR9202_c0_g1_i1:75-1412(+)